MFPEHCLCSGQSARRYHAFPANKSSLTYMELAPKFARKIRNCLWPQIVAYSSRLGRDIVFYIQEQATLVLESSILHGSHHHHEVAAVGGAV